MLPQTGLKIFTNIKTYFHKTLNHNNTIDSHV